MPNGLPPQTIDIPLLLPNQTPPTHAGPLGRLGSMVNAQIKHFLPSSQTQPQKIVVEPRDGFAALTNECRDSATGAIVTADWNNPELLAPLGNQLLSVCDGIPRVNNGASWTNYGNRRVLTQKLSEDVLHTTNHTLQAPDSAYLNGVTCFVWTETSTFGATTFNTSVIGFRGDDGAWIRTPATLNVATAPANSMARVVQDGTFFWVVFNTGTKIAVSVFDTHGALVATDTTTITLVWTPTPGYWDVAAFNNAGTPYVLIVQPDSFSTVGANVDIRFQKCTVSGSVITISILGAPMGISNCNGPLAFVDSTATGLPTVASAAAGTPGSLWITEWTHAFANSHSYSFGAILAGSGIPDSLTGWMEANGAGAIAHAAYSLLSNFSPLPVGCPANDPGLRYTRSYACTRAGAVTLTNQVNGVLLSSSAFRVDQDWYAATYYQSGGGTNVTAPQIITPANPTDYFTGAPSQPVTVQANDFATGAANVDAGSGYMLPTQLIASIAFTAGDQCSPNSGGVNWSINAGTFVGSVATSPFTDTSTGASAVGAILHVTGALNPQNNGDWFVTGVAGPTSITTEGISLQGNTAIFEHLPVGTTYALTQVWPLLLPQNPAFGLNNTLYPDALTAQRFYGGQINVAGATGVVASANGTYSIFRYYTGATWRGYRSPGWFSNDPQGSLFLLTKTSGAAGSAGTSYFVGTNSGAGGGTVTVTPAVANAWALIGLNTDRDVRTGIPMNLVVSGAHQGGNNGTFLENAAAMASAPYGRFIDVTGGQTGQRAELFLGFGANLPTISRDLVDPNQAFIWHIAAFTFDPSYLGATVVLTGAAKPADNGAYEILSAVPGDAHAFVARPIDGHSGQTLYNFTGAETITITRSSTATQPAYQPCWYLTPLSFAQNVAGRWEWAIAYGDWRFDGATKANLATFERNNYPLSLSSVVAGPTGLQFTLPYRAQSFTAGQTVTNSVGGVIGIQSTSESTVGLKLFTLATATGQAVVNSGEMLIPGPQASEFSASGFTEDGIGIGPEKPYLTLQDTVAGLALTVGSTVQYVAVWEVTDESGDRTWSVVSPPLDVTLVGTNNRIQIGGRMPGPTLRAVGVALYRTANTGSPPTATIQHYKITNDLQVNGPGFVLSSLNGGTANDTWTFVDTIPDATILSAATLYTDQGFLPRFPAPAFSQGVGSWENRSWVIGYDGAVWMSGEKTEGDSIWFHPAFRYVLPTDDKPVALAAMENYLLVFCSRSIWFIPAQQFPDATGANGELPTPQPLPFRNGCTGFALTVKAGVVYSSTAGGVWLINRSLQNIYLSQPLQNVLTSATPITGMTIDGQQRLMVTTGGLNIFVYDEISQAWLQWQTVPAAQLIATWQGNAVYEDQARVKVQTPGVNADVVDGVTTGVAPSIDMVLALGAVKALKRVWAINITGTVLGPCRLTFQLLYPDEPTQAPTTYGPFAVSPGVLNLEINPLLEETTTYELVVHADFVGAGTPGASYAIELITAEIGVESTLAKRPNAQRIPGS